MAEKRRSRWLGRAGRVLGVSMAVVMLASLAVAPAAAGSSLTGHFGGNAYGTFATANLGEVATKLGRSAYITCPCNPDGTNNEVWTNDAANVDAGDVASAGLIETSVQAGKTGSTGLVRNVAQVTDVSLLDGLVTADLVKAVARTTSNLSTTSSSASESTFGNLKIGNTSISPNVARNTKLNLAGFGTITLRQVTFSGNGTFDSAVSVNMIVIRITRNNSLDLPIGAEIRIGHARSLFSRDEPEAILRGQAFASAGRLTAGDIDNRLGKSAAIYLPCEGTNGLNKTNTINRTSVPNALLTGVGDTLVRGDVAFPKSYSFAYARVENVNVLNGLIRASSVKGASRSNWDTSTNDGANSTAGSYFVDLRVLGIAIGDDVAPNTEVNLPGIGMATLFEVTSTDTAAGATQNVTMIHIEVTLVNSLNLPVGTEIFVAGARTQALPFE